MPTYNPPMEVPAKDIHVGDVVDTPKAPHTTNIPPLNYDPQIAGLTEENIERFRILSDATGDPSIKVVQTCDGTYYPKDEVPSKARCRPPAGFQDYITPLDVLCTYLTGEEYYGYVKGMAIAKLLEDDPTKAAMYIDLLVDEVTE